MDYSVGHIMGNLSLIVIHLGAFPALGIIFNVLGNNVYMNASSQSFSNRPDFVKCPAPNSHLNNRRLSSVFSSLNFATNLVGSEYITRGSFKPAVISVWIILCFNVTH
uniref:Uncharacterized protein n=1 Tax=Opuntia streptacantha TaxID=393608 RepID=A0A7C9ANB5_OPUST